VKETEIVVINSEIHNIRLYIEDNIIMIDGKEYKLSHFKYSPRWCSYTNTTSILVEHVEDNKWTVELVPKETITKIIIEQSSGRKIPTGMSTDGGNNCMMTL